MRRIPVVEQERSRCPVLFLASCRTQSSLSANYLPVKGNHSRDTTPRICAAPDSDFAAPSAAPQPCARRRCLWRSRLLSSRSFRPFRESSHAPRHHSGHRTAPSPELPAAHPPRASASAECTQSRTESSSSCQLSPPGSRAAEEPAAAAASSHHRRSPQTAALATHTAPMSFLQSLKKRIPTARAVAPLDDGEPKADRLSPRLAFLRRRIRIKGNSSISIPLGLVVLFPTIVIILIIVIFVRHPSSPGKLLVPAGAPPSIRFVLPRSPSIFSPEVVRLLTYPFTIGKSARSTTKSSTPAV